MDKILLADLLMSIGSFIGMYNKAQALYFSETVWSRKGSLLNTLALPITALLPMYWLQIWMTFAVTTINLFIWIGIYLYRAPEDENWLGLT